MLLCQLTCLLCLLSSYLAPSAHTTFRKEQVWVKQTMKMSMWCKVFFYYCFLWDHSNRQMLCLLFSQSLHANLFSCQKNCLIFIPTILSHLLKAQEKLRLHFSSTCYITAKMRLVELVGMFYEHRAKNRTWKRTHDTAVFLRPERWLITLANNEEKLPKERMKAGRQQ